MKNTNPTHTKLIQLAEMLLDEEFYPLKLKETLEAFRTYLLELLLIDADNEKNRTNLHFENGKAIGLVWAARCMDEYLRTRSFVRGLYQAIKDLLEIKENPIQILYAGSGPFATLILPLLPLFSEKEIQISILEVNPASFKAVKKLMTILGFNSYVKSVECVDATQYQIPEGVKYDLLLSETMLNALIKEQEVPIMLNLVKQLGEEIIIIPQNIQLEVGFLNNSADYMWNDGEKKFKSIDKLMDFNKAFIIDYLKNREGSPLLDIELTLPEFQKSYFDRIAIMTTINTYGEEWLEYGQSSLNLPFELIRTDRIQGTKNRLKLWYEISEVPIFKAKVLEK